MSIRLRTLTSLVLMLGIMACQTESTTSNSTSQSAPTDTSTITDTTAKHSDEQTTKTYYRCGNSQVVHPDHNCHTLKRCKSGVSEVQLTDDVRVCKVCS